MDQTMIEIKGLKKVYPLYDNPMDRVKEALKISKGKCHKDYYVLKGIDLEVKRGESVGIVGVNGSGKSTMLKIITGVLNASEGTVKVSGKIAALLELGAGFNPEYTGIENIYLNGMMMGYTREEMKERVQKVIDFADIGDFINQPVKTYSSGMFARLAFAVSINVSPDILIVDEALSVGDTRFQIKCIDKMKELKDNGTTILFVSHAIEQIKRFCTRAIWLKDGHILEDGEASQVVDIYDNFMKYGEKAIIEQRKRAETTLEPTDAKEAAGEESETEERFGEEKPIQDIPAAINKVSINKLMFHTFERLEVNVKYEIFDEVISDFLLGVAIYSKDRSTYVFGPNTYLDKFEVPNTAGKHEVKYVIESLPLLKGDYVIDVGIFNNEGIVNFDYKGSIEEFVVTNKYFSEGQVYMEHNWEVIQ